MSLDHARNGFSVSGEEMQDKLRFMGCCRLYSTYEFVLRMSL